MELTIIGLNSDKLTLVGKTSEVLGDFSIEVFYWARFKDEAAMDNYTVGEVVTIPEEVLHKVGE